MAAAITLIALQVVVSTPIANVAGAAALPAQWAAAWMSPNVPLIPSRAATTKSGGTAKPGQPVQLQLPPGQVTT